MAALIWRVCKQIGDVFELAKRQSKWRTQNIILLSLVFQFFSFFLFLSAVCRTRHLTGGSQLLELKPGFTGNQVSLFGYRHYRFLPVIISLERFVVRKIEEITTTWVWLLGWWSWETGCRFIISLKKVCPDETGIVLSENTDLNISFEGPSENIIEGSGYQRYSDRHSFAKCWTTSIREGANKETVAIRFAEKGCATKVACQVWVSLSFVFRFFKQFCIIKDDWKVFEFPNNFVRVPIARLSSCF